MEQGIDFDLFVFIYVFIVFDVLPSYPNSFVCTFPFVIFTTVPHFFMQVVHTALTRWMDPCYPEASSSRKCVFTKSY